MAQGSASSDLCGTASTMPIATSPRPRLFATEKSYGKTALCKLLLGVICWLWHSGLTGPDPDARTRVMIGMTTKTTSCCRLREQRHHHQQQQQQQHDQLDPHMIDENASLSPALAQADESLQYNICEQSVLAA
mmetsp:Transcript_17805/g.38368  ORF Transcript_17805/g.38368 Transcript_17805/m.38368 type:complete len:133 (-) Transcript_17805:171-569(-)